jgi:predicted small lipoprotein YifL
VRRLIRPLVLLALMTSLAACSQTNEAVDDAQNAANEAAENLGSEAAEAGSALASDAEDQPSE